MKTKKSLIFSAAIVLLFSSLVFPQKDPQTLKFPELVFKPQKPGFQVIKKGVDFYFKEDKEQPSTNVLLIFKTGSLADPKDKEGLASLTMRLMKSGGTKDLAPEQVEDKLDFLGSTLSSYAGAEYSQLNLWTLSKNFDASWKILTDVLFNPRFDRERFDTEKKMELEDIRRRWDQPMMIGFYLFNDLLYGKDFPDVRRTTTRSVESIPLEEVKAFYDKNIKNREVMVAITGDFNAQKISVLLSQTFKNWRALPAPKFDLPKATLAARPGLYLIDKKDMTQAVICMGHLGINRLDRDNVEIGIMNFILGSGGFNSRLMREVRSNRGLAYATFGSVGPGRDLGSFFNFCQTKSQSVGEAIKLMTAIIADMTKNVVTPGELDTAKKYEQNAFVHRFDSSQAIVRQTLYQKLEGFPDNYFDTYITRIKKVNETKVLEMAKRTMHPDAIIILVVGKKSEVIDQLKALNLGQITELPLPKE